MSRDELNTPKHTPGPWIVSGDRDGLWITSKAPGLCIGPMRAEGTPKTTVAANVALIAAAPDLLAALKEVIESPIELGGLGGGYLTVSGDCLRRARAALSKAQPNSNDSPASPAPGAGKKGTQPTPAPGPEGQQS